ncbi:hypothetical protein V8B55DRAFT_1465957, partial [Mucor lusitanicus]
QAKLLTVLPITAMSRLLQYTMPPLHLYKSKPYSYLCCLRLNAISKLILLTTYKAKLYYHTYPLPLLYIQDLAKYFYQCGLLSIQIKTKSKSIENH